MCTLNEMLALRIVHLSSSPSNPNFLKVVSIELLIQIRKNELNFYFLVSRPMQALKIGDLENSNLLKRKSSIGTRLRMKCPS